MTKGYYAHCWHGEAESLMHFQRGLHCNHARGGSKQYMKDYCAHNSSHAQKTPIPLACDVPDPVDGVPEPAPESRGNDGKSDSPAAAAPTPGDTMRQTLHDTAEPISLLGQGTRRKRTRDTKQKSWLPQRHKEIGIGLSSHVSTAKNKPPLPSTTKQKTRLTLDTNTTKAGTGKETIGRRPVTTSSRWAESRSRTPNRASTLC